MSNPPCLGCAILARALPGYSERWSLLSAMRAAALHRAAGLTAANMVFVVGEPSLLPAELRGRGELTMLVTSREDLLRRYAGVYNMTLRTMIAQIARPAPPGTAWVLAAFPEDPASGESAGIAVYLHPVPESPSASAEHVIALALVPTDHGAAPGARITAPGGRA